VRDTCRADRRFFRGFLMSLVSRSLLRLRIFSASERVEENDDRDSEDDSPYDPECVDHLVASFKPQGKADQNKPRNDTAYNRPE
jgi:hypothetical protein